MKLIIQIPCYNEEASLPVSIPALPKHIDGIDTIEYLVINDGSKDRTVQVARELGVHHVVGFNKNQGLAKVFMLGLHACLERGADIIVNTDADNQYSADDIATLVRPILAGQADIVVGARPILSIEHFSGVKKLLQRLGSWVVKVVSGTRVADAPSGFRAFTREAALHLNVFSRYTYTLETIIQAGQKNFDIISVPVRVNRDLRPSRLVRSIPSYVRKSIMTIVRIFVIYKAFRFFMLIGLMIFGVGVALGLRFLYFYLFTDHGDGHIQSLILTAVLLMMGFQTVLLAFIADLLSVNRRLLEDLQAHQRRMSTHDGRAVVHELEAAPSPARRAGVESGR